MVILYLSKIKALGKIYPMKLWKHSLKYEGEYKCYLRPNLTMSVMYITSKSIIEYSLSFFLTPIEYYQIQNNGCNLHLQEWREREWFWMQLCGWLIICKWLHMYKSPLYAPKWCYLYSKHHNLTFSTYRFFSQNIILNLNTKHIY